MSANTILTTERFILREFDITDAKVFYHLNQDSEVLKFTGDVPFDSVEESEEFIRNYSHYALYGYGRWAVVLKESNEVLGWCGLKYHSEGYSDIGYRFFRKYWGQGFATEAAKASLKYGKEVLKLDPIWGRVSKDNVGSIRVLEKIGMTYFKSDTCEGIPDSLYFK